MADYRVIDLETWPRRHSFEFYRTFANPSFNITVICDIRPLYDLAQASGESFFLMTLYALLRGANEIPQLRQRFVDGQVIEYRQLAVMTPIMTAAEEFRQIWCEYEPDFPRFRETVTPLIEEAKRGVPGSLTRHDENYLCASCLPWLHFAGGTQADFTFEQAAPILAWGKMEEGKVPINGRFNHYFVDGLHFSRFFQRVEASFLNPESLFQERQF